MVERPSYPAGRLSGRAEVEPRLGYAPRGDKTRRRMMWCCLWIVFLFFVQIAGYCCWRLNCHYGNQAATFSRLISAHTDCVRCLVFIGERFLAVGYDDQTVKLWDVTTGREQLCLDLPGATRSLALSPDGQTLATGTGVYGPWHPDAAAVILWDVTTGALRAELWKPDSSITALAFVQNGQVLVALTDDGTVQSWDTATWHERRVFQQPVGDVKAADFSPEKQTLAVGTKQGELSLWDLTTGQRCLDLALDRDILWSVTFSPDGRTLATTGRENVIRLWNITKGMLESSLLSRQEYVRTLAFSPDGKVLASGSGMWRSSGEVTLWNRAGKCEPITRLGHESVIYAIAFSPSGKTIASGDGCGVVKIWDRAAGRLQRVLKGTREPELRHDPTDGLIPHRAYAQ